jgi:hypothetical protein
LTASDASTFAKAKLGPALPAFRIMTPKALQRAAFKKHGCTDTGAVMYGVFLDIEHESLRL